MRRLIWFFFLLTMLTCAQHAKAQPPASSIQIGSTNVAGGTPGDCLTVNSARRLGQKVCGGPGGVTSVSGTTPISVSSPTTTPVISLNDTAVTPASYTNANITVDQKGRITAAANGTAGASPAGSAGQYQFKVDATTFGAGANTTNTPGAINIGSATDAGTRGIIRLVPNFGAAPMGGAREDEAIHAIGFYTGSQTADSVTNTADIDIQLNPTAQAQFIAAAIVAYSESDEDTLVTPWLVDIFAEAPYADNPTASPRQAGIYIQNMRVNGSSATNSYGLYFEDQGNGSNDYALYAAGATAKSRFEGTVDVGAYQQGGAVVGSAAAAVCWKTTTTLSYCTSVVGAGGTCTCH